MRSFVQKLVLREMGGCANPFDLVRGRLAMVLQKLKLTLSLKSEVESQRRYSESPQEVKEMHQI